MCGNLPDNGECWGFVLLYVAIILTFATTTEQKQQIKNALESQQEALADLKEEALADLKEEAQAQAQGQVPTE